MRALPFLRLQLRNAKRPRLPTRNPLQINHLGIRLARRSALVQAGGRQWCHLDGDHSDDVQGSGDWCCFLFHEMVSRCF